METKSVKTHPKALYPLFFTEMWERFGFYCMLAVFVFYMMEPIDGLFGGGLGFSQVQASKVYGSYLALVYFTPMLGGIAADRFLGYFKSIALGGVFMMIGYFLLSVKSLSFFYGGLVALMIGNGLFKPNISTMLGISYDDRPSLKDSGFTIFYMGINIGALFSPIVASYIKSTYSWNSAFAVAGVGMAVSLIIMMVTRKYIRLGVSDGVAAKESPSAVEVGPAQKYTPEERFRVQALMIIYVVVIVFWMSFHQNGLTLNLWAKENTLPLHGIDFAKNAELTQAINPFFVIFLSFAVVVPLWSWLRKKGREPTTPAKMLLGMLLTALAFSWMALAGLFGGDTGRVSAYWLIWTYATITLGELCLSPMGLSVVSKLAPQRSASTYMGLWFVATSLGNYLSGAVGTFWERMSHSSFFLLLVASSLMAAFALRLLLRRLEKALMMVAS